MILGLPVASMVADGTRFSLVGVLLVSTVASMVAGSL
jgi:hypothetical protein